MSLSRKVLITGATSGLGEYIAGRIGGENNLLILGRNADKMRTMFPSAQKYIADLSHLGQVSSSSELIAREHEKLDVIICNAAILGREKYTPNNEGIEETLAVNYLSHYILLARLWSTVAYPTSKVIIIGSSAASWFRTDFSDPGSRKDYKPLKAYGRTKSMLMMLGQWINSEFSGSGPEVYIIDPGTFRSGISRSRGGWFRRMYQMASWAMSPVEVAAKDILAILEGKDYSPGRIIRRGMERDLAYSNEEISKLLQMSSLLTGFDITRNI
ncbi:MAG: SDR family NAD(P)-dependent oxidoreductase [Cyclobacteriaceae bacterium]